MMIKFCMAAMLALPLLWATPQAGAPLGSEYWSSTSIDQAVQKLDAKVATDPHRVASQPRGRWTSGMARNPSGCGFCAFGVGHLDRWRDDGEQRDGSAARKAQCDDRRRNPGKALRWRCGPHSREDGAPTSARWIEGIHLFRC
jgi:hypothetical protein